MDNLQYLKILLIIITLISLSYVIAESYKLIYFKQVDDENSNSMSSSKFITVLVAIVISASAFSTTLYILSKESDKRDEMYFSAKQFRTPEGEVFNIDSIDTKLKIYYSNGRAFMMYKTIVFNK